MEDRTIPRLEVHVSNVEYTVTAKQLADYFSEKKNVPIVKCTTLASDDMNKFHGWNNGTAFLTLANVDDYDELLARAEKKEFDFEGRIMRIRPSRAPRNVAPKDASRVFAFDAKVKVGVLHGENRFLSRWDVNRSSFKLQVHVVINFQARHAKFSFTKKKEKLHVQYHMDDVEEMINFYLTTDGTHRPVPREISALLLRTKAAPKLFKEGPLLLLTAPMFTWEKVHTDEASGTAQRTTDFSPNQTLSKFYDVLIEPYNPRQLGRIFLDEATRAEYNGLKRAWPLKVRPLYPPTSFEIPKDLSFRVRFQIEALFSDAILCKDLLSFDFYKELTRVEEDDALAALAELRQIAEKYDEKQDVYVNNYPLRNPLKLLQKSTRALHSQTALRKVTKKKPVSDTDFTVNVHRLLVSPLKQYCWGPAADTSNRILREYSGLLDHFLRVSFTDEDHNKLVIREGESMQAITDHFRGVLRDGVVVGGREYEFLGMSSSQMREHSCWFFARATDPETGEEITADSIRKKMGDFSGISIIAKYAARMGQCFSSTISTKKCRLEEDQFEEIPDCEKEVEETVIDVVYDDDDDDDDDEDRNPSDNDADGNCSDNDDDDADNVHNVDDDDDSDEVTYCLVDDDGVEVTYRLVERKVVKKYNFTDGIGAISPEFAKTVAESTNQGFRDTPSAFQIRFSGYKGVVAVKRQLEGGPIHLQLRPSMRKFQSDHNQVEVCNSSAFTPAYLNRQIILLLACRGVPERTFIRKQEQMLQSLKSILVNSQIALKYIKTTSSLPPHSAITNVVRMIEAGFDIESEPYIQGVLQSYRTVQIDDLRKKSRIFVSDAACIMGVIDETDSLDYGQVFVQVRQTEDPLLVEGPVVVTKNPCFHPGDIRVLNAVNPPALRHLYDVIVFPARGPRPHTDEISGSDLDGDLYFVSWDKDLLPPERDYKPMDYTPPDVEKKESITMDDVKDFIIDYIRNDQLGQIANAHLVQADLSKDGAKCSHCVELAELHSLAVDFPKTGVIPTMRPEHRPPAYPDFMQKSDRVSYESNGVIGTLFHEVKMSREHTFAKTPTIRVDEDLLYEGYQRYINDAIELRDIYNEELYEMMRYYDIRLEEEALTGNITRLARIVRRRRLNDVRVEIRKNMREHIKKYRKEFHRGVDGNDREALKAKASALYYVTYRKKTEGERDYLEAEFGRPWRRFHRLISCPWIACDYLCSIKALRVPTEKNSSKDKAK